MIHIATSFLSVFNQELLTQSMPRQVFPMVLEPIGADTIEAATNAGEPLPFTLKSAVQTKIFTAKAQRSQRER